MLTSTHGTLKIWFSFVSLSTASVDKTHAYYLIRSRYKTNAMQCMRFGCGFCTVITGQQLWCLIPSITRKQIIQDNSFSAFFSDTACKLLVGCYSSYSTSTCPLVVHSSIKFCSLSLHYFCFASHDDTAQNGPKGLFGLLFG